MDVSTGAVRETFVLCGSIRRKAGTLLRHTLEVIFRSVAQLFLLVVLLPLIAVVVVYTLPRSYQSWGTLWALHRYAVIGTTGLESDLLSTPAQTQATALAELLQTRSFALSVANATALPSTLPTSVKASPQVRDDDLFTDISLHVQVAAQGYNLFVVTYTNANPSIAQQVVQATVQSFGAQSQDFSVVEAQHLLEGYQTELTSAQQKVATAIAAEARYQQSHASISKADLANDPQYALLHTQTQQAQDALTTVQGNIATINEEITTQGTGADSLFKVLDAPSLPYQPMSRLKTFLYAGGIGLGGALLAYALYVVLAVRRDRSVYVPLELQKITAFPVIMELPLLGKSTIPLVLGEDGQGENALPEYAVAVRSS